MEGLNLLVVLVLKSYLIRRFVIYRYQEVNDTKDFFNLCKKSQRVVAHFYRGVTPRCEIVDAHFERLAATHIETRFIKVDVEKNPFLVERLKVIVMPTIVLIKDGKTEHSIKGFDEFGGTDDFSTNDVAYVLSQHGVLNFEVDRSEEIAARSNKAGLNALRMERIKSGEYDDLDDDFDD
jgi:thioredoxin-like negative regulator of GroEL